MLLDWLVILHWAWRPSQYLLMIWIVRSAQCKLTQIPTNNTELKYYFLAQKYFTVRPGLDCSISGHHYHYILFLYLLARRDQRGPTLSFDCKSLMSHCFVWCQPGPAQTHLLAARGRKSVSAEIKLNSLLQLLQTGLLAVNMAVYSNIFGGGLWRQNIFIFFGNSRKNKKFWETNVFLGVIFGIF